MFIVNNGTTSYEVFGDFNEILKRISKTAKATKTEFTLKASDYPGQLFVFKQDGTMENRIDV